MHINLSAYDWEHWLYKDSLMIYKYYSPYDYNFDALRKSYFFFSYVKKLNDPFDCSAKLFLQFAEFVKMMGYEGRDNEVENIMKNYATCSFSKEGNSKHQWALYASNYSGFCVAFDDSQILIPRTIAWDNDIPVYSINDNDEECVQPYSFMVRGDVIYVKILRDLDDKNAIAYKTPTEENPQHPILIGGLPKDVRDRDPFFMSQCFIKETEWEHEKEFRLFIGNQADTLPSKYKHEGGLKIDFKRDWVKQVVIGHNMQTNDIIQLVSILKQYPDVEIFLTSLEKAWNIEFKRLDRTLLENVILPVSDINLREYIIKEKYS